jgi:hypothetical protein
LVERIYRGHALTQGIVAEECPAAFPVFVMGEIENFRAIRALIGKLFLGAVRVGDER